LENDPFRKEIPSEKTGSNIWVKEPVVLSCIKQEGEKELHLCGFFHLNPPEKNTCVAAFQY
jgi:hypothetical protein